MAIPAENVFSLGELMAKAREDAGLDQEQMRQLIGVSRTTISRWENNRGAPSIAEFRTWATVTGADWLWRQVWSCLTPVDMPEGQMELALDDHAARVKAL
jgi:transcriptional regulator with XRE-family HTH domain